MFVVDHCLKVKIEKFVVDGCIKMKIEKWYVFIGMNIGACYKAELYFSGFSESLRTCKMFENCMLFLVWSRIVFFF